MFEKISKIDMFLARLTKEKEEIQITNIRNERGDITSDSAGVQRTTRG
jgi:isocitrate dehydrogenase